MTLDTLRPGSVYALDTRAGLRPVRVLGFRRRTRHGVQEVGALIQDIRTARRVVIADGSRFLSPWQREAMAIA